MKKSDFWQIVAVPAVLVLPGLLELYSINPVLFYRQLLWVAIATAVLIAAYLVPEDYMKNIGVLLYVLSVILLLIVLALPAHGPKRWINLGSFKFQPSEPAKFATIVVLARLFDRRRPDTAFWRAVVAAFIPFALTLIEPDLGTSVVFVFIGFAMAYLAGVRTEPLFAAVVLFLSALFSFMPIGYLIFVLLVVAATRILRYSVPFTFYIVFASIIVALLTPVVWEKGLHDYQRKRIIAFFQPEKFEKDIGWQTVQAHIALGSGGFTGKGFRRGTQKGLAFLPAAHTDFIFSSIGEEFGFLACSLIVILFAWWIIKVMLLAGTLKTGFARLFAYGVALSIYFHAFVNIGANLGLLPVVGLPLPLITYGGSHLLTEGAMLGVLFRGFKNAIE